MDPVTHTLIGVGLANAFFRRRIGPESVPILAIASNLPDVDAIVHLTGDPTAVMMRRTFGHSLFLLPIWVTALSFILRRFYPRLNLGTLFGLSLLGSIVHLFFDLVNSFGVVLFWPFNDWRPELAIIFIIDLFLTGILAAPLLLCIPKIMRPHLVWLSRVSIVCVAAYVLFCGANRVMAKQSLAVQSQKLADRPDLSYVFTEPFGPHRWKGVLRENNIYHVYLIHSLTRQIVQVAEIRTETGDPVVNQVRNSAIGRRIEWFFKAPVWSRKNEAENEDALEVQVYDLRFRPILFKRGIPFTYRFHVSKDGRIDLLP